MARHHYALQFEWPHWNVDAAGKEGIDINQANKYGSTPPTLQVWRLHWNSVGAGKGRVDINQTNNDGWTLIRCKFEWPHWNRPMLLAKEGIDINQANKYGSTPLYAASLNGTPKSVEYWQGRDWYQWATNVVHTASAVSLNGRTEIVSMLLAKRIDLNQANNDGSTPYTLQVWGHQNSVDAAGKEGTDLNQANKLDRHHYTLQVCMATLK